MAICEKCWTNAYLRSVETGKSQYKVYQELLDERKDCPCLASELVVILNNAIPEGTEIAVILQAINKLQDHILSL